MPPNINATPACFTMPMTPKSVLTRSHHGASQSGYLDTLDSRLPSSPVESPTDTLVGDRQNSSILLAADEQHSLHHAPSIAAVHSGSSNIAVPQGKTPEEQKVPDKVIRCVLTSQIARWGRDIVV